LRLITEDTFWNEQVDSALERASKHLAFSAVRELISREVEALEAMGS
jgi:hypothetical protein